MTIIDAVTLVASLATAFGVAIAAYQIRVGRVQNISQFEDGFAKEYREVAQKIPVRALLGAELSEDEKKKHFDELFRYFDLSNEQVFLRQQGRIHADTWAFWRDGMKSHFQKAAFRWAWDEIEKTNTTEFSEFRRLVASGFKDDPKDWKVAIQAAQLTTAPVTPSASTSAKAIADRGPEARRP